MKETILTDEIKALNNQAKTCSVINKKANELINKSQFDEFSREELFIISSLSANESMVCGRKARNKIADFEKELNECKRIINYKENPCADCLNFCAEHCDLIQN